MTVKTVLIAAATLALSTAAVPAFAHDDYADHAQHWRFHDELRDAHRRAHEEGFESPEEHAAFHRALRYLHREYHDDNPGNWHDHDSWRYRHGWRYGGWYGGARY
jgi:hypothetical protein